MYYGRDIQLSKITARRLRDCFRETVIRIKGLGRATEGVFTITPTGTSFYILINQCVLEIEGAMSIFF